MKSPFPGMDPFIECQEWEDFHSRFNNLLADTLTPSIEPDYFVRVERRVYVESHGTGATNVRQTDVAIVDRQPGLASGRESVGSPSLVAVECLLPMPEERRETYLLIRQRSSQRVVTVIELLSPTNKRSGADGRVEYLKKRSELLSSEAHLVEIDLLRGGKDLPVIGQLPPGDYHVCLSRAQRRPRAEVYAWPWRQPLPTIPIPLKLGDADTLLDLQQTFSEVYTRARYDLSIDYHLPLMPALIESDQAWLNKLLSSSI